MRGLKNYHPSLKASPPPNSHLGHSHEGHGQTRGAILHQQHIGLKKTHSSSGVVVLSPFPSYALPKMQPPALFRQVWRGDSLELDPRNQFSSDGCNEKFLCFPWQCPPKALRTLSQFLVQDMYQNHSEGSVNTGGRTPGVSAWWDGLRICISKFAVLPLVVRVCIFTLRTRVQPAVASGVMTPGERGR